MRAVPSHHPDLRASHRPFFLLALVSRVVDGVGLSQEGRSPFSSAGGATRLEILTSARRSIAPSARPTSLPTSRTRSPKLSLKRPSSRSLRRESSRARTTVRLKRCMHPALPRPSRPPCSILRVLRQTDCLRLPSGLRGISLLALRAPLSVISWCRLHPRPAAPRSPISRQSFRSSTSLSMTSRSASSLFKAVRCSSRFAL